jgi:DNA replication protein DnaC
MEVLDYVFEHELKNREVFVMERRMESAVFPVKKTL